MNILNKLNYINTPTDLMSILKLSLDSFGQELNCVRVGIVQEFLHREQIVRVKIASQRLVNINEDGSQTTQDYAEIYAKLCYATPYMNQPPKVGDECVLLFNDREMESWWINGSANQRAYNRMHDLTDCIAICGLRSQPKLVNIFTNLVEFFYDTLAKTNIKLLKDKIVNTTDKIINYVVGGITNICTTLQVSASGDVQTYMGKATIVCPDFNLSGGSYSNEHTESVSSTNALTIDDEVTVTPSKGGGANLQFNSLNIDANTVVTTGNKFMVTDAYSGVVPCGQYMLTFEGGILVKVS